MLKKAESNLIKVSYTAGVGLGADDNAGWDAVFVRKTSLAEHLARIYGQNMGCYIFTVGDSTMASHVVEWSIQNDFMDADEWGLQGEDGGEGQTEYIQCLCAEFMPQINAGWKGARNIVADKCLGILLHKLDETFCVTTAQQLLKMQEDPVADLRLALLSQHNVNELNLPIHFDQFDPASPDFADNFPASHATGIIPCTLLGTFREETYSYLDKGSLVYETFLDLCEYYQIRRNPRSLAYVVAVFICKATVAAPSSGPGSSSDKLRYGRMPDITSMKITCDKIVMWMRSARECPTSNDTIQAIQA
jgi:hypothetical protein